MDDKVNLQVYPYLVVAITKIQSDENKNGPHKILYDQKFSPVLKCF